MAAQQTVADEQTGPAAGGTLSLGGKSQSQTPSERDNVEPTHTDEPPRLDGVLDESAWRSAALIDACVQPEPSEGDPATERTVVRLMYDEHALYVGVEAYDSNPNAVIATEMRRDCRQLLDEDNFQLIFDTFNDSRSGDMFVTNPLGATLEQQIAEEGEGGSRRSSSVNANVNLDWDGVWDVSAHRTDWGWVAEIAIPMVTMRFPEADRQVWGVNVMRNIRRKNEQVFWAPIEKGSGLTRISQAGTVTGLGGVDRGMDLRITPYALAGGRQDRAATAGLAGSGFNDVGPDVKYGVASDLNRDVTLNTDCAQVKGGDRRRALPPDLCDRHVAGAAPRPVGHRVHRKDGLTRPGERGPVQSTSDVTIPAGTYRFRSPSVRYNSDPSRRLSAGASYSPQGFFGGARRDWRTSLNFRATSRIAAQASVSRSDVDLPGGAVIADLASATFDLALSPEMTLRSVTQYNSTIDSISTSVRFNWIYSPGSDIYIAYDELRDDDFLALDPALRHAGQVPWVEHRQLAIKMTYLLSR